MLGSEAYGTLGLREPMQSHFPPFTDGETEAERGKEPKWSNCGTAGLGGEPRPGLLHMPLPRTHMLVSTSPFER